MTTRTTAVRGLLREHGVTLSLGARTVLTQLPRLLEDAELPLPVPPAHRLGTRRRGAPRARNPHSDGGTTAHDLCGPRRGNAAVASEVPGVGLLTATALVASVGHIHAFRRGRQFASWLGLTPREHSSGTRRRRGAITKQGHRYLRSLLTHGARSVVLAGHRRQRTGTACTPLHQGAVTMDPVRFE